MDYLPKTDNELYTLIEHEAQRQAETLMLIPSENYASKAVEEATGSILGNKYAEGYPGKRYYQGQEYVDQIETLTIERAKKLFGVPYANVQPYSGSPANSAVFMALLEPGDTVMGLTLSHGGHLTHGHPKVTFSGSHYNSIQYGVGKDEWIDFDALAKLAKEHQPKLIIAGTTAYPRTLEFDKFATIADMVGAYLMADVSHISGLIVAGAHPSPVPHAHVVTTTTHKTLRGPRGAMILVTDKGLERDDKLGRKINSAIIPGLQGGPHLNTIAGIAVALHEANTESFKAYGKQVVANAATLAKSLMNAEIKLTTDGTDNHLMVADLRNLDILGKDAAVLLESAGMVLNYNTVPYDPNPPFNPSGIRLGTPGMTTRGMGEDEMKELGQLMAGVLKGDVQPEQALKQVHDWCEQFPIPESFV